MSNFLVVCTDRSQAGSDLFRTGLSAARILKNQTPSSVLANGIGHAATFPRRNGTGSPVVKDAASGSWMLAAGSWFHRDGFHTGAESKLLSRILADGLPRVLGALDGWFTLVVGDAGSGEVLVATDPTGGCCTFIREHEGGLAVSGSSMVLAAMAPSSLDPLGCQEFLRTGVLFEGRTLHREVWRLGPGTLLRVRNGAINARERTWSVASVAPARIAPGEAAEALHASLVGAARRVQSLYARPVCDLTGGYDSRAVVASFLAAGSPFSTTVTGDPASADVTIAADIARVGKLRHEWLEPRPPRAFSEIERASALTDGEYDPVEYAQILSVHERLSARHAATINGSNGEIARGHWWRFIEGNLERGRVDERALMRARMGDDGTDPTLFPPAERLDINAHLVGVLGRVLAPIGDLPAHARADAAYLDVRLHCWQARIASATDQLWPCLSPFSFRSVIETALSLPPSTRTRSGAVRRMLGTFHPSIARIPLAKGYPAMALSWRTLPHFRSTPLHLGRKAWARVEDRVARISPSPPSPSLGRLAPRMHLLAEQRGRDLLDPVSMQSIGLLDRTRLRSFLAAAESNVFPFDPQWNRLLGLELLLGNVRDARRRIASESRDLPKADRAPLET